MDISHLLEREVFYLTTLISLIFAGKRHSYTEEDRIWLENVNENNSPVPDLGYAEGSTTEEVEPDPLVREIEFEVELASADKEVVLNSLKRNALDRLAEILARFKTDRMAQLKGEANKTKNLDAKHVASTTMIEDKNGGRVMILCSKNNGIDSLDQEFLANLKEKLEYISKGEILQDQCVEDVFKLMFDHQKSRVEYYSAVLESVFKHATTDTFENANKEGTVEHSSPDNTQAKLWEDNHGLYFKIYPGGLDEGHSSEEARPLSNKEDETTISDTVQQIRSMFGNEETKPISAPQMCRFLRSVYAIIRHPRQRPALKSLLRLELNGNEKRYKNAWNALLFLVRIYYCTSIIVELGSKCKSFRSIKFIPVQKKAAEIAIRPEERKETPLATMKALNCFPKSEKWIKFFEREKTIGDYQRLLKTKRTVHAEVQMIHSLETNPEIYRGYNDLISYIGCSKKCCFFCDVFRIHHAKFSARGTHETVFHIWALPEDLIPLQEQEWLSETKKKFSAFLRSNLISVVSEPFPPQHQSLLQQSSAALSTAKALQREEIKHSEMPQINKKLMFPGAFAASEKQVMFAPIPQEPGYATFLAPGMPSIPGTLPIEDPEMHKINHDRRVCSLEPMGTMPEMHYTKGKACRYCQQAAEMRCADCWTFYCSKTCQRRHWSTHFFGCRVPKRPNLVDYLRYSVEKVNKAIGSGDENAISQTISELFADDDICREFGYSNCSGIIETMLLAQLYATVISSLRTPMRALRLALEARDLRSFLRFFCEEKVSKPPENQQDRCIMWFLERSKRVDPCIFDQRNTGYDIWLNAIAQSLELLGLEERLRNGEKLDFAQTQVFYLFINIQPFIGWFPDIYSSVWKNFGFCYCKTYQQKRDLAKAYMALAYSEASFDDMVTAYKAWTMEGLMKKQGISPPLSLKRPSVSEDAVFRLMTGVEHALSGRHCTCFQMSRGRLCHSGFETHLDIQSDVCYGFHLSSSWERWRLLNFYKMLFQLPGFNPREMAKAKECGQKGDLEEYLNSLVPNMRRDLLEIERAQSIFFPSLNGHISMNKIDGEEGPAPQFACACKIHDMAGPPGLQWISADQVIRGSMICAQIEDGMPLLKAGT